jgi:hypothetical protein
MKSFTRFARTAIETRALRMLRTLSTSATIRAEMQAHGYTDADHDEGWRYCLAVAGFGPTTEAPTTNEGTIRAAVRALEDFTVNDLTCFSVAVKRLHPEHHEALFGGLTFARGPDAMIEATLFIERYAPLLTKHAKKGDHAVVALLERRGLTRQAFAVLSEQADLARSTPTNVDAPDAAQGKERDVQLAKLEAWLTDWTTTARRAIQRRDQQLRLGIGRRHRAASPVVPPAPAAVTPALAQLPPAPVATPAIPAVAALKVA